MKLWLTSHNQKRLSSQMWSLYWLHKTHRFKINQLCYVHQRKPNQSLSMPYRLNEYVVLSIEQVNTWILMEGFNILSRRGRKLILRHAAAGLPLPDLKNTNMKHLFNIHRLHLIIRQKYCTNANCMMFSPRGQACDLARPPGPCGPHGCGVSARARWLRGPSRNDLTSWAWCTPERRDQLQMTKYWFYIKWMLRKYL